MHVQPMAGVRVVPLVAPAPHRKGPPLIYTACVFFSIYIRCSVEARRIRMHAPCDQGRACRIIGTRPGCSAHRYHHSPTTFSTPSIFITSRFPAYSESARPSVTNTPLSAPSSSTIYIPSTVLASPGHRRPATAPSTPSTTVHALEILPQSVDRR